MKSWTPARLIGVKGRGRRWWLCAKGSAHDDMSYLLSISPEAKCAGFSS